MPYENDQDHEGDGVDRRGFLECMAWAGTGLVWAVSGGVLSSRAFGAGPDRKGRGDFTFVQISDSHIGFSKETNKDVTATLQETVAKINTLPRAPDLLIHTGDLTHLSKPGEFDIVAEVLKGARAGQVVYVPGEHDVFTDDGKQYLRRFGRGTMGTGWQSFNHQGVHFVGLVNVMSLGLKAGGLGVLGKEQLDWLRNDLAGLTSSTPIVVYAHVPLWMIYPEWGWGTEDGQQALSYLKRFGSVTVLNGHIHQILQKVEGNVTFHTARSTAFPQPAPGQAAGPGPIKNVPAEKLRSMLGLTSVNFIAGRRSLAVIDSTLG
ncbi:Calcineurin-like phosphoesterase [Singulisphaera sp. GP187]|uniref:metallophosphoesterase family protein n=1 Tax=Singulisphaera sp. GP187 TaxID=1882752 RepID=UPI00092854BD|nr:metallophosphoesterase [Singulisphaera sp. GP187]SIO56485.1 Calcineurin-like phosphoesterase [Singulisphaera sp. GP187]